MKYLSNSGSKKALFELFFARAKNELKSSEIRFQIYAYRFERLSNHISLLSIRHSAFRPIRDQIEKHQFEIVPESRINFPLASVLKSSVTWNVFLSESSADNFTDNILLGFKPVRRYDIFQ